MNLFFYIYVTIWSIACILAIIFYTKDPKAYSFSPKDYWAFIFTPWKIITFIVSAAGMIIVAPYSGDFTWDYWDALFMALLTFLTAPWVVGIIFRLIKRRVSFMQAYVAVCIWLFSVSWSYDLYLLIRDGQYPATWFMNLIISSSLYILAGLLWNLDWLPSKGVVFAFKEPGWPKRSRYAVFRKIWWEALILMGAVTIIILKLLHEVSLGQKSYK